MFLLLKLHQRTVNFQTKLMREQGQGEEERVPRIGERSESFNERLVAQLGSGSGGQIAEVSENLLVWHFGIFGNCVL